jgi:Na+/proline symporter
VTSTKAGPAPGFAAPNGDAVASDEVAQQLTQEPDRILPVYVVEHWPTGLSGLLIATIFAAGISTLDSALTVACAS